MIISLYQLQAFYLNEINRGVAGLGQYHIDSSYGTVEIQSMPYFASFSPEDIVKQIRSGVLDMPPPASEDTTTTNVHISRSTNISSIARANEVLKEGNISFDDKLHCFTVKGTSGVLRVVTLFPKETCSCPSTGDCYHLMAVRLSVGMPEPKGKVTSHNLTVLRKNTRSRKEKKCGRKRPRPNDVEPECESGE